MSEFSYTPKAMAQALKESADLLEQFMRRKGAPPADIRYRKGAMLNAVEVLEWISNYSKAIEKAAKKEVPWRSSNS